MTRFKKKMGVTRKNMRCCRPFPDSLLRQPNLMNSWERGHNKDMRGLDGSMVLVEDYKVFPGHSFKLWTHPTRNNKIVNADQILLQLQKLLEVLHLDEASLELLHHLRHICQSSCRPTRGERWFDRLLRWFYSTRRPTHAPLWIPAERRTSAVPEIPVSSWIMFAQALQDLLVVTEAVQRPQDEDVEGDVADLLQLKVPAESLQPAGRPACLLQLQQNFRLFMKVCCQGLWIKVEYGTHTHKHTQMNINSLMHLQKCKSGASPSGLEGCSAWHLRCAGSLLLCAHWSGLP